MKRSKLLTVALATTIWNLGSSIFAEDAAAVYNIVYPESAFSWDGEKLVGIDKSGDVQYSYSDGVITATVKNLTSAGYGHGAFTNLYRKSDAPTYDVLSSSGFTMKNSTFENNTSEYGGNSILYDGTSGTTSPLNSIIDTKFISNKAFVGGALALYPKEAYDVNGKLSLDNVTFTGNMATSTDSGDYSGGGAILADGTDLTIANSKFTGNEAQRHGGAIKVFKGNTSIGTAPSVNISNTEFISNKSSSEGGALYLQNITGNTTFDSVTFKSNSANVDGGAIAFFNSGNAVIINSLFEGNVVKSYGGGAIYSEYDTKQNITIKNTDFTNNSAGEEFGGAIAHFADGTLDIEGGTFSGNTAGGGGAIASFPAYPQTNIMNINGVKFISNNAADGGAIANYDIANITGSTFDGNTSTETSDGGGGAIFLGSRSQTTIKDSVFSNNTATGLGGVIASRLGENPEKAGEYRDNSAALLDITGSKFTNNKVTNGNGGAIYNTLYNSTTKSGYAYIGSSTFISNSASNGGAIYLDSTIDLKSNAGGKTYISDSVFEKNSAAQSGGAIYNTSEVIIDNGTFTNNKADSLGGAIYNTSEVIIDNGTFTNNKADSLGGAIYNAGTMVLNASNADITFSGNTANGKDNDIYNEGTITLYAEENKKISLAGGIEGENGTVNITGKGKVETAGNLLGNTVNVNAGELHLSKGLADGSNAEGVVVKSNALINTIDGVVNNYADKITLNDSSSVRLDVDLDELKADTFTIADGETVTLAELKVLKDFAAGTTSKDVNIAEKGNITADNILGYTSDYKYTAAGQTDNTGIITITQGDEGSGGLNNAIADTTDSKKESVTYTITGDGEIYKGNSDSGAEDIATNTTFTIEGENKTITANNDDDKANINVKTNSTLTINNTTLANFVDDTNGAIKNSGILNLNNVTLSADDNTAGIVNNGTANVEDSIIAAVKNTSGTLNVTNGSIINEINNQSGAKVNIDAESKVTAIDNAGALNLKIIDKVNEAQAVETLITNTSNATGATIAIDLQLSDHDAEKSKGVTWSIAEDGLTQNSITFTGDGHLTVTGGNITADIVNQMTGNTLVIDEIEQVTGNVTNDTGAHMVLTNSSYTSGTITNNGLFEIYDGTFTLPSGVSGTTGTLNIGNGIADTDVTSANTISQQVLNILGKGSLTVGSDKLTISNTIVTNDGTLVFNDTNNNTISAYTVSGSGKTVIAAADSATITAGQDVIKTELELKSGTFNATGDSSGVVTLGSSSLIAAGGTLSTVDTKTGKITLGNVDTSSAALNVNMDLDWSTATASADVLSAALTDATNGISIKNITLTNTNTKAADSALIADDTIDTSKISIANLAFTNNTNTANSDLVLSTSFVSGQGTYLNFASSTLADAIENSAGTLAAERAYAISNDTSLDNASGALELNADALSISTGSKTITGTTSGNNGIALADNTQTLSITGDGAATTLTGFKTAVDNSKGGTVNLTNTVLTGNTTDVDNDGTLNLSGTNTINTIADTAETPNGTANILDGTTTVNTSLTQAIVNVSSGATLAGAGAITSAINNDGTINSTGNLTLTDESTNTGSITAVSLLNTDSFTNDGEIKSNITNTGTFTNNSSDITGTITNGDTTTDPSTPVSGTFVNTADLTAATTTSINNNAGTFTNSGAISTAITNAAGATFTNTADGSITDNGSDTGALTNNGTFNNAGTVDMVAAITNAAGADITNTGTISSAITNSGDITNSGSISGAITSTAGVITNDGIISDGVSLTGGTLNNNGNIVDNATANNVLVNNGGVVNNSGTITTTAAVDNQSGTLQNTGTINSDLTNAGDVINNGTIAGDVTNTNGNFDNAGTISGDFTNSVTTANAVKNSGVISGDVTNTGTIETTGTISGAVHNNGGTLEVDGGTISGDVGSTSTGTINVNNNAAITGALTNQTVAVAAGAELSAGADTLTSATNTVTLDDNSTLNLADGSASVIGSAISVAAGKTANLAIDVNPATGKTDSITGGITGGQVAITDISLSDEMPASAYNGMSIDLATSTGIAAANIADSKISGTLLTPIRYLQGSVTNALLTYAPTGGRNDYDSFNSAVVNSEVAAQAGAFLGQLNTYSQAFSNMDMYMLMTRAERNAMKFQNKYAAMDGDYVFDPTMQQYENKAGWFRPYATFESIGLKNGPRVSNVMYGTFLGGDSNLYDLGNGWDGMFSVYAAYNGSHQAYQGNSIYQNGGTLGLSGIAYKNDFFAGLTANVGANMADAKNMYGSEDFSMLMTGVAGKTGYNWELADGKFIIQPSYQMSYSFINTFDYTNSAGVRINSDPLHAITFEPGIKFIGNLNHGWQPYAGVSVVWNVLDKSDVKANDVSLPEMSVKPYAKYGVGVRKKFGERLTGFIQTFFTSGGRNGVGFQFGLRWALGKSEPNKTKKHSAQMPQKEKTNYSMKNV